MNTNNNSNDIPNKREYEYGFNDGDISVLKLKKGLDINTIREISNIKNEPQWMRDFRIKSFHRFLEMDLPKFGPDLSNLILNNITYYLKPSHELDNNSWENVPDKIKKTFERLGIKDAEKKYLSGVGTQYDSEMVYHNTQIEVKEQGVIFCDPETALKKYPELFKKYFAQLVEIDDNKFSALNSCVWSGGTFIYVPKGVKIKQPLQTYFRINSKNMGQFERTLIILDEGAELNYVEGCTAPIYSGASLHAAVVEIFVGKNAKCRYTTIQNWSDNVYNLVTKRAKCDDNASMEWIDGNIGSGVTMKYPSCILSGKNSKGTTISIALASKDQHQDTGTKMIHLGKNSSSTIISKSISKNGGNVTYRGKVYHDKDADNCFSHIECDTIIMDKYSKSDTIPFNYIKNGTSVLEHEAKVSKISEEQLFYLMSRGITEDKATEMIVLGFMEPFTRELPMEYAVELNQLIKMEMEGSVG